jgi:ribosome-associated heat shock protein Hsp15
MSEKVRIDKYLWAIRLFKTRTQATDAIDAGRVKYNGAAVKPSRIVSIGDQYDIKTEARKYTIQVTNVLPNRVGYEESLKYYSDQTPEEEKISQKMASASFFTGKRMSKTGKPSKKQRREMQNFMDSDNDDQ